MVYFDVVGNNGPWIINSSPESEVAYREAAQDPWFNQIQTIGWGPSAHRSDAPPPGSTPPPGPGPEPTPPPGPGPEPTPAGPAPAPPGDSGQSPAHQAGANGAGYWMLGADGKIYPFGNVAGHGDATAALADPAAARIDAADVEPTPSG